MSGVFGPTLALAVLLGAGSGAPGIVAAPPTSAPVLPPVPAATSSSAASDSATTKLREIGHVKALTDFCKTALDRTNKSIVLLLENDRRIGDVQNTLRTNDFDYSELSRSNGVRQLFAEFAALRAAAVSGNGQMALLKEQLKAAPTDGQKASLLALEQALDGALMRQKRLADRIGRMVVILENQDRIDSETRWQEEFDALRSGNDFFAYHDPEGPLANLPWSLTETAAADVKDVQEKADEISHDEDDASDRLDAAFADC